MYFKYSSNSRIEYSLFYSVCEYSAMQNNSEIKFFKTMIHSNHFYVCSVTFIESAGHFRTCHNLMDQWVWEDQTRE